MYTHTYIYIHIIMCMYVYIYNDTMYVYIIYYNWQEELCAYLPNVFQLKSLKNALWYAPDRVFSLRMSRWLRASSNHSNIGVVRNLWHGITWADIYIYTYIYIIHNLIYIYYGLLWVLRITRLLHVQWLAKAALRDFGMSILVSLSCPTCSKRTLDST